jgi:recombination protein RecA
MYGEGISRISEILDMGVKYDLIEKAGSFYSYNSERMGQGEANARQWLKDHPEAQQELLDKIMARSSGIAEEMTTGPIDDDADDMMASEE